MVDPDWPPRISASKLPDGTRRRGSTGQLFEVCNGQWIRKGFNMQATHTINNGKGVQPGDKVYYCTEWFTWPACVVAVRDHGKTVDLRIFGVTLLNKVWGPDTTGRWHWRKKDLKRVT